jgi:hypothetical protein
LFNKPGSKQYLLVQKISALFKMLHTFKKAKQAKKQWQNAGSKFGPATENTNLSTNGSTYITSESSDKLSSDKLSSGELSSDESVSATCKLYSKKLPSYVSLHILISKDEAVIDHTTDCQEEKACNIYWGLSTQQVLLPELLEESSNQLPPPRDTTTTPCSLMPDHNHPALPHPPPLTMMMMMTLPWPTSLTSDNHPTPDPSPTTTTMTPRPTSNHPAPSPNTSAPSPPHPQQQQQLPDHHHTMMATTCSLMPNHHHHHLTPHSLTPNNHDPAPPTLSCLPEQI